MNSKVIAKNISYASAHLIQCYIINLLSDSVIRFRLIPDDFSESLSANYEQQEIRGRSAPFISYNATGARTVSLSVTLYDEFCDEGILPTVNKLKALVYPSYEGSIVLAPKCFVRFGHMIGMRAVVDSVGVNWEKPILFSLDGKQVFNKAEVSLEFTEIINTEIPTVTSIERNGGFTTMT